MAVACDRVGGQTALARAIGRPQETVSDWVSGKYLVDPEHAVEIERITGVSGMSASLRKRLNCCRAAT